MILKKVFYILLLKDVMELSVLTKDIMKNIIVVAFHHIQQLTYGYSSCISALSTLSLY